MHPGLQEAMLFGGPQHPEDVLALQGGPSAATDAQLWHAPGTVPSLRLPPIPHELRTVASNGVHHYLQHRRVAVLHARPGQTIVCYAMAHTHRPPPCMDVWIDL